jgi:hypothetical protein
MRIVDYSGAMRSALRRMSGHVPHEQAAKATAA